MHYTLLVPDLLPPPDSGAAPYRDLQLPALTRLLARGRRSVVALSSMEAWLCTAFDVERQQDWPVAPLTLALDGRDPGNAYWLRCDPVHLRLARSQLILSDSSAFAPTPNETRDLIAALNAYFSQDGLSFHAADCSRWYVRLEHTPALVTHALPDVAGRDIDRYLPAGDDGLGWHRRLNEIQMLLHAHPVSQAREARNEPAINSVWPWGGGVKTTVRSRCFTSLYGDDAVALALAAASDIASRDLPHSATLLLSAAARGAGKQLVVLPQLRAPAIYGDLEQWRAMLTALERNWFAPLYAALHARRLSGLAIVALGAGRCWRYDLAAGDLWKFWRRLQPVGHHA